MKYNYYIILFLIAGLQTNHLYAQTEKSDSLLQGLEQAVSLEEQTSYLNSLASYYMQDYPDTAYYYAKRAVSSSEKASYQEGLAHAYLNLAVNFCHYSRYNFDSLSFYLSRNLAIHQSNLDSIKMANTYYTVSKACYQNNNYVLARQYGQEASSILENQNDKPLLAANYSLLCEVYHRLGNNELSVSRGVKALRVYDDLKEDAKQASLYNTLGSANFELKYLDRAKEYLLFAMEIAEKYNLTSELSDAYLSMGEVYLQSQDYEAALSSFRESMSLSQKINDEVRVSRAFYNIGKTFVSQGENEHGISLLGSAYDLAKEYGRLNLQARASLELGRAYFNLGEMDQAYTYLNQSLNTAKKIGSSAILKDCYLSLANYYSQTDNLKEALVNFKLYDLEKENFYKREGSQKALEQEVLYDSDKKDAKISLLQSEREIQDLQSKERKLVNYGLTVGIFLLAGLGMLFYSKYRLKIHANKKLEKQKEAINQQKLKIEKQRDEIISKSKLLEENSKDIKDSIMYAKRLQMSLLPDKSQLKKTFPDSFVFFKPKDIVSGDFYWLHEVDNKVIIAALDCTGHGVPGAFMTVLANSILNQLVLENKISAPNIVLSQMDDRIQQALHQHYPENNNTDGLDMAVCIIDRDTQEICFSGAQMNAYYFNDGEMDIFQPDRYSIGGVQVTDKYFTNKCIKLERGNMIYLASDGFQDQFGGPKDKKFMRNRFRELLTCLHSKSTADQFQSIQTTYNNWRGNQTQTDDIMVIGIRI